MGESCVYKIIIKLNSHLTWYWREKDICFPEADCTQKSVLSTYFSGISWSLNVSPRVGKWWKALSLSNLLDRTERHVSVLDPNAYTAANEGSAKTAPGLGCLNNPRPQNRTENEFWGHSSTGCSVCDLVKWLQVWGNRTKTSESSWKIL